MNLRCEDCFLQRKCKYFGVSPLVVNEDQDDAMDCILVADNKKSVLVNIPTSFTVDAKTGKISVILCTAISFRKRWWNRLQK